MAAAARLRPHDGPGLASTDVRTADELVLERNILSVAAGEFGIPALELVGRRRTGEVVRVRSFVVWALRSLGTPRSYPSIGRILGGRDHTTIINLHEKAMRFRQRDADFRAACDRLARRFQAMKGTDDGCTSH